MKRINRDLVLRVGSMLSLAAIGGWYAVDTYYLLRGGGAWFGSLAIVGICAVLLWRSRPVDECADCLGCADCEPEEEVIDRP